MHGDECWHLSQDDQLSAIFHHGTQTAPFDTWILIWSPKPLVSCLSCLSGGQRVLQAAWADGFSVRDSVSNYPLSCTTVWLCAERKVVLHSFLATSRIVLPFCKVVAIHTWGQCVGWRDYFLSLSLWLMSFAHTSSFMFTSNHLTSSNHHYSILYTNRERELLKACKTQVWGERSFHLTVTRTIQPSQIQHRPSCRIAWSLVLLVAWRLGSGW